nr:small structural protein [Canine vesivirus]
MSVAALITAGASATSAGTGLIGSIANAIHEGTRLKLQGTALGAQVRFQEAENQFNRDRFEFDKMNSKRWYQLAAEQQALVYKLNTEGPVLRAKAMMEAGFRNNLASNGNQLTFNEVREAQLAAERRFYNPQIHK